MHLQQQQNCEKERKPDCPINNLWNNHFFFFCFIKFIRKNKKLKEMKTNEKLTIAFKLSLAAGCLVFANALLLGAVTKWFPTVMPTFPGTTGNDSTVLFALSAIGLTLGILILFAAFMLRINPENRKLWGATLMVFSVLTVIMGGGFLFGFLIGIYGGLSAIRFKPENE